MLFAKNLWLKESNNSILGKTVSHSVFSLGIPDKQKEEKKGAKSGNNKKYDRRNNGNRTGGKHGKNPF